MMHWTTSTTTAAAATLGSGIKGGTTFASRNIRQLASKLVKPLVVATSTCQLPPLPQSSSSSLLSSSFKKTKTNQFGYSHKFSSVLSESSNKKNGSFYVSSFGSNPYTTITTSNRLYSTLNNNNNINNNNNNSNNNEKNEQQEEQKQEQEEKGQEQQGKFKPGFKELRSVILLVSLVSGTGMATYNLLYGDDLQKNIADSSYIRNIRVLLAGLSVTFYYKYYLYGLERGDKEFPEQAKIANKLAAEALVELCQKNKGIFIKFAQILSSLDHLLPVEYTSALTVFQDHFFTNNVIAPYEPFEEVVRLFMEETGKHPDDFFEDFERTPIASASLAQVHKANLRLPNGEVREVAVKVQYPDLTERFEKDIESIYNTMIYINWFFPKFQFSWILPEATSCLNQELDFVNEGKNSEKIASLFHDNPQLYIPKVYWDHTTRRILTMEFIHGVRIDNKKALTEMGIDFKQLYYLFSEVFAEQIFVHGFLHSDPHPGNILIRKKNGKPEMVLLDHGLYKKIDEKASEHYARELGAGEYAKHLGVLLNLRPEKSRENLRNMVKELGEQTLTAVTDILKSLPKEILLVLKTNNLIRQITTHFRIENGFLLMAKSCIKGIHQPDSIISSINIKLLEFSTKALQICFTTSLSSITQLQNDLRNDYISTRSRQIVVKHLDLVILSLSEDKVENPTTSRAHELVSTFKQSPSKLKYIIVKDREDARRYIALLRRYFTDQSLDESMAKLTIKDKKPIILQSLLIRDALLPELVDVLTKLKVFQISVSTHVQKVTLFGSLSPTDFWQQFETAYSSDDKLKQLPSISDIKEVVEYHGGLEGGSFIEQSATAGGSFNSCDIDLDSIPIEFRTKTDFNGRTIGGFIRANEKTYIITACHVVCNLKIVGCQCPDCIKAPDPDAFQSNNLFRGQYEDTYIDVAFLPVKDQNLSFMNPLASDYSNDALSDYWQEYVKETHDENWYRPSNSFPPGTDITKIGLTSGFTKGSLVDVQTTWMDTQHPKLRNRMVAVRGMPNQHFTRNGDSGSVYYATQGCMSYPIAIHCGVSLCPTILVPPVKLSYISPVSKKEETSNFQLGHVSYGSNLRVAIDWWMAKNEEITKIEWLMVHHSTKHIATSAKISDKILKSHLLPKIESIIDKKNVS
ncbi:putative protein serine/threonine kinase [Cavenderia fasciculata]|uniref:ABC1 atypical kinase-like domain-containing protein n=1 Tax=Cavenderia fasciculata TaxID=261658 RepID=F4PTI1_CACFS|nr:putative protein serine/threonine kinase [Cavenderia fasciculata]EGG20863.1 putative protein serine/threonine kinase [Cavenderia fasciculata]|eukprot:XP_004358713.1 putative protein serine/threonine kinase [Cavenderia fasciculata]